MNPFYHRKSAFVFADLDLGMWRKDEYEFHTGPVKVIGYDTETADGKAILITNSLGEHCYPTSFIDCLDFITKVVGDYYRFFWNINYDITAMVKWLDLESLKELEETEELKAGRYSLTLTPKFFSVSVGKSKRWVFTDLMAIYHSSLDAAAKKYLNEGKIEYDVVGLSESDIIGNLELRRYCVRDSELTAELGQVLLDVSSKLGKLPKTIYSPASISESLLYEYNVAQPWNDEMKRTPSDAIEAAYNSYCGGWVQMYQRGYFPKVRTYDINSAYPTQMLHLPDLFHSGGYYHQRQAPSSDAIGWLLVTVTVPNTDLSHIRVQWKNGGYYPSGTFTTWATSTELDGLSYEVIDGWWLVPERENEGLASLVMMLYENKKTNKGVDIFKYLYYKIALNAMYGKTIQVTQRVNHRPKVGRVFNPFYGSLITAGARMQVYRAARDEYPRHLVSISTDSFWTVRDLPQGAIDTGPALGQWEDEGAGPAVLLSSGVYEVRGEVQKSRSRSISNGNQSTPWFDILSKANTVTKHTKGIDNFYIVNVDRRRVALHAALYHRTHSLEDLNRILDVPRWIDLNSDVTRDWGSWFTSAKDVLSRSMHSMTKPVDELQDISSVPGYKPQYLMNTEDYLYEEMLHDKVYCQPGMDVYAEFREGVSLDRRRILSTRNPRAKTLDEYASKYGCDVSSIIAIIANVPFKRDREEAAQEQWELEYALV